MTGWPEIYIKPVAKNYKLQDFLIVIIQEIVPYLLFDKRLESIKSLNEFHNTFARKILLMNPIKAFKKILKKLHLP